MKAVEILQEAVTILILVDGFLQLRKGGDFDGKCGVSQSLF